MKNLGSLWNSFQTWLFPTLEDELGELHAIDAVRHRPTLHRPRDGKDW